jgi:hypothetical protein
LERVNLGEAALVASGSAEAGMQKCFDQFRRRMRQVTHVNPSTVHSPCDNARSNLDIIFTQFGLP